MFGIQHEIAWPDGQRKLLSINGAPIKNAPGEITSLVFSIVDMTARVRGERNAQEISR